MFYNLQLWKFIYDIRIVSSFMPNFKMFRARLQMRSTTFKGEWNSDIHMISVNGEDQQDLTVKVWANLDNPFSSYGFLKF